VVEHASELAAADASFDKNAYIGLLRSYFLWVNVIASLLQPSSRLVSSSASASRVLLAPRSSRWERRLRRGGPPSPSCARPKTAENATDYSVMNTAKQLLWLPTTRAEKYKGQAAVDSFFVAPGRPRAAFVVFAGTAWVTRRRERLRRSSTCASWPSGWFLAWALVRRNGSSPRETKA